MAPNNHQLTLGRLCPAVTTARIMPLAHDYTHRNSGVALLQGTASANAGSPARQRQVGAPPLVAVAAARTRGHRTDSRPRLATISDVAPATIMFGSSARQGQIQNGSWRADTLTRSPTAVTVISGLAKYDG